MEVEKKQKMVVWRDFLSRFWEASFILLNYNLTQSSLLHIRK